MRSCMWVMIGAIGMVACTRRPASDAKREAYDAWPDSVLNHAALRPKQIVGTLVARSPAFGAPGMLAVGDGGTVLWMLDFAGDPSVHAIALRTRAVVRSLGRRGEGPGEFSSPTSMSMRSGDSGAVWVFDVTLQRMTRVTLPAERTPFPKTFPLMGAPRVLRAAWVGRDRVAGVTNTDSARIAIFDSTGRRIVSIAGPILGDADSPLQARISASTGFRVCGRPDGSGFAIAYFGAGRIDFFNADGTFRRSAQVPFPTNGHFQTDSLTQRRIARRVRYYYRDCAIARDNTVFALFAGRSEVAFPEGRSHLSEYVHVFNPDGTLRTILHLSRPAEALDVSGDAAFLYTTSASDGDVYQYPLDGQRDAAAAKDGRP